MTAKRKSRYGGLLTKMIKDTGMTQIDFYTQLGITKPYFYDIISGKVSPPPSEMQFKIINILRPDEKSRNNLFQIAGEERKETPADIALFLKIDKSEIKKIRNSAKYAKIIGGKVDD